MRLIDLDKLLENINGIPSWIIHYIELKIEEMPKYIVTKLYSRKIISNELVSRFPDVIEYTKSEVAKELAYSIAEYADFEEYRFQENNDYSIMGTILNCVREEKNEIQKNVAKAQK